MNKFSTALGQFIKQKRKEIWPPPMTHERLAQKMGVTRPTIANIEKGRGNIRLENLILLSRILQFDLKEVEALYDEICEKK